MSIHFLVLLSLFCFRADCLECGLKSAAAGSSRGGDSSGQLVLIRHGQSESNKDNLLSWPEVKLTQEGREEAEVVGDTLKQRGFRFDYAITSHFIRAQESLGITLEALGQQGIKLMEAKALDTRSFGKLGGKTKEEVINMYGNHQVKEWYSANYNPDKAETPPPNGETLKSCDKRVKEYYAREIAPLVAGGKKVLVVTHRNPTISIMEAIDGKSEITESLDGMKNAAPIIYNFNSQGKAFQRTMMDIKGNIIESTDL